MGEAVHATAGADDRLDRGSGAEARFVLRTAGLDEADPLASAQLLAKYAAQVTDWQLLIVIAHQEGALPLLARLAAAGAIPGAPDGLTEQLSRLALLSGFRSGLLERRLRELLTAFEPLGDRPILLKGCALATSVYPRYADRPMGDLDVLIPEHRAADFLAAAESSGWKPGAVAFDDEAFDGHQHLPPLHDGSGLGIRLDLHLHLIRPSAPTPIDTAAVRTGATARGRTSALVPSLEHLLLHACVHFAWSHAASAGAWKAFRDVRHLLADAAFDRGKFEELVRETRSASCVFWTLHLAAELGGVAAAGPLSDLFAASTPPWCREALTRHFRLALTSQRSAQLPVRLQKALWELAVRPAAHGHGAARPWDENWRFVESVEASSASPNGTQGRTARLTRMREVIGYFRSLTAK